MSAADTVSFLSVAGVLKRTKRTGWVLRGVNDPESVAAHSFRMGLMAFLALDEVGLDAAECMRIALCHDLAEAIVGDLVPGSIDSATKHRAEAAALDSMCRLLQTSAPHASAEIRRAYAAYETSSSEEARFVKDCDKLDMELQALEYEGLQPGIDLGEFFESTRGRFKTRLGQSLDAEVRRCRQLAAAAENDCPLQSSKPGDPPQLLLSPTCKNAAEYLPPTSWMLLGAFSAGAATTALATFAIAWLVRARSRGRAV